MKGRRTREILSSSEIERAIKRVAYEILERNRGPGGIILMGIPTPGPFLARRIRHHIEAVEGVALPTGSLDVTFYRDDIDRKPQPLPKDSDMPGDISGRTVVLVDDVLFTGRTVRAALDALVDLGRPDKVQLAVLVDRGHRELPIRADFVGRNIPTGRHENIKVALTEMGAESDTVFLSEGEIE